MELRDGGVDVFYIDESERFPLSFTAVVRVPFLRSVDGSWRFVWSEFLDQAIDWRRALSERHRIRFREELHGYKILLCKGQYLRSWRNLSPEAAVDLYRDALSELNFLPPASIMTTFATEETELTGYTGMMACLTGLFQRLVSQCNFDDVNGMAFFDEGHEEYIRHFRRSQKYLPTGSIVGAWPGGEATRNLPLSMFIKDGNFKKSHLSLFLQIADLVVYAARIKQEHERGRLTQKRVRRNHHTVYDAIPQDVLNLAAPRRRNDAIVPI